MTFHEVINFDDYAALVPLMAKSLWAALILGVVGGTVSVFVQAREAAFAVHGIAELSFSGASLALFLGVNVVAGSVAGSVMAALVIAVLSRKFAARSQSIIGVLMPTGLGLGILFLSLYQGRSANKFGLLTGQIVAIEESQLAALLVMGVIVMTVLVIVGRPLLFASVDAEVAKVHGVPVYTLHVIFMILLGLAIAMSVHVVGALLVLAILVTPAASASYLARSPQAVFGISIACGIIASVGGVFLSLGSRIPVSPYVTCLSFLLFIFCRLLGFLRARWA